MRTAGPIHWPPVSCVEVTWSWENWSLPNVCAFQASPETPEAAVPAATWEEIARPPSLMSVQFGPRLPFARLKLSEAVAARALSANANGVMRRAPMTRSLSGQRALDREPREPILIISSQPRLACSPALHRNLDLDPCRASHRVDDAAVIGSGYPPGAGWGLDRRDLRRSVAVVATAC